MNKPGYFDENGNFHVRLGDAVLYAGGHKFDLNCPRLNKFLNDNFDASQDDNNLFQDLLQTPDLSASKRSVFWINKTPATK